MAACKGKSTEELIAAGLPKLASMGTLKIQMLHISKCSPWFFIFYWNSMKSLPWWCYHYLCDSRVSVKLIKGGGGGAAPAAAAAGAADPAAAAEAAPKKEEKKEESEEEDDDMGFGLFD